MRGTERTWQGYLRADGRAATRNELWIIPTVGCVARTAQALATAFEKRLGDFPERRRGVRVPSPLRLLAARRRPREHPEDPARLATHPNAGGALVLGLGCENNHLVAFKPFLGEHDRVAPTVPLGARLDGRARATASRCSKSSPSARTRTPDANSPPRRWSSGSSAAAATASPASPRTCCSGASPHGLCAGGGSAL